MSAGFTPGPWEAHDDEDAFFQDVNITRHDGLAVAVAVVNGDIGREEANRNANLIAAAPNMWAALNNAAEFLQFYFVSDNAARNREVEGVTNIRAEAEIALEAAARALAKVRGETL